MKTRKNNPKWLICHHSAIDIRIQPRQFWVINNYHKQKWHFKSSLGLYGGYHYLIEIDGKIQQYRSVHEEGAHTKGMNLSSIGICLAGNFSKPNMLPTKEQKKSLKKLLLEGMRQFDIPLKRIVAHRFFASTECYGLNLPLDWARDLAVEESLKYDDKELKVSLLKKQIDIIERLIKVYVLMISFLSKQKED